MPQKLNKAGKMQDYIPAGNGDPSGEYGTSNGTNKNFTTADKKKSSANVITENKSVVVGDKDEIKKLQDKYGFNEETAKKVYETKEQLKKGKAIANVIEKEETDYPLDSDLIRQANYSSNFYEAGDSIKRQYDKFSKDIDEMNLSDEEKAKAKTKLQQLGNEALRTQAKNISWGVSGRGNLNVSKVKKNSDIAMNKRAEFENYVSNLKVSKEKQAKQQAKAEAKANVINNDLTNSSGYDGKIHLQGVGKVDAKKAENLKVGDITMWNYGGTETVEKIEKSKSGNMLTITIKSSESGKLYERKMKSDRLVGIAEKEAKNFREQSMLAITKGKA